MGATDKNRKAKGLEYKGLTYTSLKDYNRAVEYFETALALREETENLPRIALVLDFLSAALIKYGGKANFKKALVYTEKSMKIAEELKDRQRLSSCYSLQGNIYIKQGKFEPAIKLFLKSCLVAREVSFHRGEVSSRVELAYAHLQCGQIQEAAIQAQKAYNSRQYFFKDDQEYSVGKLYQVLLKIVKHFEESGDLEQAQKLLQFAHELETENKNSNFN